MGQLSTKINIALLNWSSPSQTVTTQIFTSPTEAGQTLDATQSNNGTNKETNKKPCKSLLRKCRKASSSKNCIHVSRNAQKAILDHRLGEVMPGLKYINTPKKIKDPGRLNADYWMEERTRHSTEMNPTRYSLICFFCTGQGVSTPFEFTCSNLRKLKQHLRQAHSHEVTRRVHLSLRRPNGTTASLRQWYEEELQAEEKKRRKMRRKPMVLKIRRVDRAPASEALMKVFIAGKF